MKKILVKGDESQIANQIMRISTGTDDFTPEEMEARKQAAQVLGRLGGLKGGPARAKTLSKKRRVEIARKAAAARWGKKKAVKKNPTNDAGQSK